MTTDPLADTILDLHRKAFSAEQIAAWTSRSVEDIAAVISQPSVPTAPSQVSAAPQEVDPSKKLSAEEAEAHISAIGTDPSVRPDTRLKALMYVHAERLGRNVLRSGVDEDLRRSQQTILQQLNVTVNNAVSFRQAFQAGQSARDAAALTLDAASGVMEPAGVSNEQTKEPANG